MGILIDVFISGGAVRPKPGKNKSTKHTKQQLPPIKFTVSLDSTGDWYLQKPYPKHFRQITTEGRGKWYKDTAGSFVLRNIAEKKTIVVLRSVNRCRGPAFCWPRKGNRGAIMFDGQGNWSPTKQVHPKSWIGVMVKGGGGAGLSGEGGFAAVMSLSAGKRHGCSFFSATGRLGAVAGFSGGMALVYATGFRSPRDFNNFSSSGTDFALAVGTKLKGLASPKWAKMVSALDKFDGGAEMVEGVMKGANPKYQSLREELPGLAKSLSQGVLIDPDIKNITVIDVPMAGAGAELGIYYGWSTTKVLSSW